MGEDANNIHKPYIWTYGMAPLKDRHRPLSLLCPVGGVAEGGSR